MVVTKVRDIARPDPLTLAPGMSVRQAVAILMDRLVDGAPVLDDNREIIGYFSKRNIFQVISKGIDTSIPIEGLMDRDVSGWSPDNDLETVLGREMDGLLPEPSPRLVADESGLTGTISGADLIRALFNQCREISSDLDAIINSTHNLIVAVDEHGMIKWFNHSAEKLLGRSFAEVRGVHIHEVFPNSGLINVIKTGRVEPAQKIKLNGLDFISNRSPIKKDGRIIGAIAILQDISELESISRELKQVKELFEELDAIVESSFDGLYITDGNGITLRLNKAFERLTGIEGLNCVGRHVNDLVKNDRVVSESVSALVLERREPVTIIQETKIGKTTLSTGTPVFDKNGNIFRVVCNVRDITELNSLRQELELAKSLSLHYQNQLRTLRLKYIGSDKLVVKSERMRGLMDMVVRVAQVDSTVLVTGGSGTGKELIAETIHNNSVRKKGPFIRVNCGAIPENLLESELFGYVYGAFTGAKKEGKAGYFELANGGTLFLDEIGDLPLNLQVKLLRVLQHREITRVGGVKPMRVDVRIIACTNQNLKEMVRNKAFREDLYYRLNVIPVNLPPLAERREEIPYLVDHFLQLFKRTYKMEKRIVPEVLDVFMKYGWPGNVRELENLVERLVVTVQGDTITQGDLPGYIFEALPDGDVKVLVPRIIPLREAVESVERQLLEKAYAEYRTTREMARELKVDASTIVRKAAKYHIVGSNS
ncbi:MAG: sigma 54-interacting transcriptional regulator [Firmicutes bacterium]|nr:sigma 54-interacting transcriptional regulator [Bacillota bacterium]